MRKVNFKSIVQFITLLSITAMNTCAMWSCTEKKTSQKQVQFIKIDTVKWATEQSTLQYPGKVKAASSANLAFKVSGTIERIYVENGSRVKKGQLLAAIEDTDYRIQLEATKAEYKQIKGDAERVMALYKEGGTTASANDKARYGLQQITAKLKHHEDELAYTRLYAPYDGIIESRLFEEHETVGAGMPVLAMMGGGQPEVEINLPAAEFIKRESFKQFYCTFDIYPGKVFSLQPNYIVPRANANQLYTMRLKVMPQAGTQMPSPGMNTMVTISCDTMQTNPLSVYNSSIIKKDKKTVVFVYNAAQKKVHAHEVKLMRLLSNGRAIVQSSTLQAGDLIVASGAHFVEEGETVTPLPATSETNVGGLL